MPEELQSLLDRIQRDGVEKAETEARAIVSKARQEAEAMAAKARGDADALVAQAKRDAAAYEERARTALRQAARDAVLSVAQSVQAALQSLVRREVSSALGHHETLRRMLVHMTDNYFKGKGDGRVDVLLSPAEQKEVADFFLSRFAAELKQGLEIKADDKIVRGFRVSAAKGTVEHDFTDEAIAQALAALLRPALAEIVKDAMASATGGSAPRR
jgi:V/A-type H+-transporting ATPase subunit E